MMFEPLVLLASGLATWGARNGRYSYVISHDSEYPEDGFLASWRDQEAPAPHVTNRLGYLRTMGAAEAACRHHAKGRRDG